jgi:hypothetical protein
MLGEKIKEELGEIEQRDAIATWLLQPGVTILAGRPSSGKTRLAVSASGMLASRPALYCALEARERGVPPERSFSAHMNFPTQIQVLDDPRITANEITAWVSASADAGLVIVDYLGLVREDIGPFLITLSRLTIPVIVISQLYRGTKNGDGTLGYLPDAREILSVASRLLILGSSPQAHIKIQGRWRESPLPLHNRHSFD